MPCRQGIQQVPGAGQPGCEHWPEVYRRIRSAGKLVQVFGAEGILDELARQLVGAEGIVAIADMDVSKKAEAEAILERYGACPEA